MASLYDYNYPIEPGMMSGQEGSDPFSALDALPGVTVSSGFFANRAARTILSGSRKRKWFGLARFNAADATQGIHPIFLNPFSFGKYPHVAMYGTHPFARGGEGMPYSPFGTSKMINSAYRYATKNKWFKGPSFLRASQVGGEAAPLLTPGYSGILTAAGRISKLAPNSAGMVELGAKQAANLGRFFSAIDMPIPAMPIGAGVGAAEGSILMEKNILMQAMLGSGSGTLTGAMGGFIAGSMAAPGTGIASELAGSLNRPFKRGYGLAQRWASEASGGITSTYRKGVQDAGIAGAEKIAKSQILSTAIGKSLALKLGANAPALMSTFSAVSNVLFIFQLAKFAGTLIGQHVIKPGLNFARDAFTSYTGSYNKPIMGMGFRDTEATATMRQRGVQAIQNSRLNARSILGNEAGLMYSHFG